ncbi:probable enoyl-CoA hydratase, mitochondrial [Harpegnathos saltator]|uniref:Probable enoyl-CoA hydratase, mitochondrial n=1 Tax=Harpegnathos saltator TaxID=610380 RepID=E2C9L5_HARSA|nr:probable enoyl-CoA hydratase, mitochondrial [Harpegnathos saltator]EFN75354.1 Probable enoyl-CoA hydratase, mitochondrial [Harpegnathos saltator]
MSVTRFSKILFSRVSQAARFPQQFAAPTIRYYSCQTNNWEYLKVETAGEKNNVGLITLNRPKVLNAICKGLMVELYHAMEHFDKNPAVGAIVITGSEKAFAAGADIKEMKDNTFSNNEKVSFLHDWENVSKIKKPIIAAVNGYALGGGCELAMMCDIIYAGDKAKFGQPEIIIGTIPGGGGTQRLPRYIGKSKAMEIVLTGNQITAEEAEKCGLVSKVFPADKLIGEAVKLGERISSHSQIIVGFAKRAVNTAYETSLQQGIVYEKQLFHCTFATADQKEGMDAFMEKRSPKFTNE